MRTISSTTSDLPHDLRLAVTRLARRLRQRTDSGLTPSQRSALAVVESHGPLAPSELADRERIGRPAATRLIARLGDLGLVARLEDPVDRRSHRVALTAEGAAHVRGVRRQKDEVLAAALARLPAEDRATLARAAVLLDGLLEEQP